MVNISFFSIKKLSYVDPKNIAYDVSKRIGSPDGKHSIVMSVKEGGGAISPHCIDYVFVVSNNDEPTTSDAIYDADCSAVSARWEGNKVVVNVENSGARLQNIRLRNMTADRISIVYNISKGEH